jgi:hypothetical protein
MTASRASCLTSLLSLLRVYATMQLHCEGIHTDDCTRRYNSIVSLEYVSVSPDLYATLHLRWKGTNNHN